MKAEIITIGTELLLGNIVNTNSRYLAEKLAELGIDVYYHTTVGDNEVRIKEIVINSLNRSDILILTGGLGPTGDDITKEVVSEVFDAKLTLDDKVLTKIQNFFNQKGKSMSKNNIKQAYIPENSIVLDNDVGTAPGIYIEKNDKIAILLPGPPKELKVMFQNYVVPLLSKKSRYIIKSKVIKTFGIGESKLESIISNIINDKKNPTIATYAKKGQVEIRITAKAESESKTDCLIESAVKQLKPLIKDYVYSYNNETLEEVVFNLLKRNGLKIGFCESCTGGLISSRFTKLPGVSEVFERGIVTYSNKSKIEEVGVKDTTLKRYGAVSSYTALEMAKGLMDKGNIDIAVSVTGIAGPTGDTNKKPVGLVYIGFASKDSAFTKKINLTGDRIQIQNKTADIVFSEIRKYLLKLNDI
ncbi:competence/damage-inducible protein A [Thermohalobacter berrensis]|uniref:Putative competence-damage inducible protein n=1 Tax=Thermohalobacter berrensis TaxID=99594 RepID=A0A419TAJ8_9FIRM|nr:competence/damage-inducible protein A [Thermohalobacter berrensis]RKD34495.1 competence/damage-inducible protein A [Thermohalobacter berrensis]